MVEMEQRLVVAEINHQKLRKELTRLTEVVRGIINFNFLFTLYNYYTKKKI